ncbi:MAG: glycosyltransferase family 4 protein, partial [Steroidobacteraceae bacterium]
MSALARIALVGNSLPRRCGIATFTSDLQRAIERLPAHEKCSIVAMTDEGRVYDYPSTVCLQIDDRNPRDYERVAHTLNRSACEIVSLQHEFGIFGGEAGSHILALTSRLAMPLITTFHTVLERPTEEQRRVVGEIVEASARVIVMAEKGLELLRSVYRVEAGKIAVIPHGTPDSAFLEPDDAKQALGFGGRPVILTFGLLSPGKGIELMIDAMPEILKSNAAAVYVVLGATHPKLVREQGETYRNGLTARVLAHGIEKNVVFLDRFVDQATLLRFIAMCDVYATPYLKEAQMTSGTLAYSFGLGKAVV